MRFSWPEIGARAKAFFKRHVQARYERGETQAFDNEFFAIFGVDHNKVAMCEKRIDLIDKNKRGYIDLFWPAELFVEQRCAGKNLEDSGADNLFVVVGNKIDEGPYTALKRALKAEIDEDSWASLAKAVSFPFIKPTSGKICVKVINHFGGQVQKVFRV